MSKLQISELTLRNFRSFGDDETIIKLEGLGPVLITGHNANDPDKVNGIGKSSLAESIIWCLFGRLPGTRPSQVSPGDWVINSKSGKNCLVRIKTKNGYIIERTRKMDGHNDLMIFKDGLDISDSTNKNTQQHLNSIFNLNYDVFISGIFFGQSGDPFLEMSDQKRKKTLEYMLNLMRFDKYAEVSKEKVENQEREQIKYTTNITSLDQQILMLSKQIQDNYNSKESYELQRKEHVSVASQKYELIDKKYAAKSIEINTQVKSLQSQLDNTKTYDIKEIEKSWMIYNREVEKLDKVRVAIQKFESDLIGIQAECNSLNPVIIDQEEYTRKLDVINSNIEAATKDLQKIMPYDLENLKSKWEIYEAKQVEIKTITEQIVKLENDKNALLAKLEMVNHNIILMEKKAGTICPECKQEVKQSHIKKISSSDMRLKEELATQIAEIESQIAPLQSSVNEHRNELLALKPNITMSMAETANAKYTIQESKIVALQESKTKLIESHEQLIIEERDTSKRKEELGETISKKSRILSEYKTKLQAAIDKLAKPVITVNEANLINSSCQDKLLQIQKLQERQNLLVDEKYTEKKGVDEEIEKINTTPNPYILIIKNLENDLNTVRENKKKYETDTNNCNTLIKHADYIRKVYSDRKCIRSFVMSKLVPFFNERIAYYLNVFECDFKIEFNSFLQTQSDKWPYELWSGGQKRRIDLAIMLAIHDLHESIYDKQCNILVFDEYDRSLDASGVYAFVNIIFKDFIKDDQTILIISHNTHMQDMFPTKLQIIMKDGISTIDEIR